MSRPRSKRSELLSFALTLAFFCGGCSHPINPQKTFEHARQELARGDLARAREEATAAYKRFNGHDLEWAWKFRLLEAEVFLDQAASQDVLSLLEEPIPPQLATGDLAINRLILRGSAYAQLDRFQEADQCFDAAQGFSDVSHSPLSGEIQRARGVLEIHRHNPAKAGRYFRHSLELARQKQDQRLEMTDLLNLGVVANELGHYDESIDWSNDAYRSSQVLDDKDAGQVALGNLAWAYDKMGDFDRALALYQDAEKAARELAASYDEIGWLNNIGLVYYQLNQLGDAERYYQESLGLAQKNGNSELVVDALKNMAFVSMQRGQLIKAEEYGEKAFDLAHRTNDRASELYPLLVKGKVAGGRGDLTQAENIFLEVVKDPKSDLSLRWEAQNDLARLYEQKNLPTDADKQYRQALTTVEQARSSLQHEEFKLPFLANAAHLYDDYIHFLLEQKKDQRALEVADYSRARTLAEGLGAQPQNPPSDAPPLDAQKIAGQAHATILFYWLGRERSYLWAITSKETVRFPLPPAGEIDAAVQRYRRALLGWQDILQTANADGLYLYNALLEPTKRLVPQNSRVIIISDGSLDNLNFETLPVPDPTPHYWIEDATVVNASSLRVIAAAAQTSNHGTGRLLLIGDPVSPSSDYGSLPNATSEIVDVEKHFAENGREVYASAEATPIAYLSSAPAQFSFIHFVAHATASKLAPLDSAIVLSRSSPEQDSFKLYARDITRLPLHAKLVTISSCYGAGARAYSGEGLVGLSWAFLRAGAHNVIGALWEVNDASTAILMDRMYDELQHQRSPEVALRTAKLSLLHANDVSRKPFYWAPFQLYTGR